MRTNAGALEDCRRPVVLEERDVQPSMRGIGIGDMRRDVLAGTQSAIYYSVLLRTRSSSGSQVVVFCALLAIN